MADDTNSSDGLNEELESELNKSSLKTKSSGNRNKSKNDDVIKTCSSDSTKQKTVSQSLGNDEFKKVPENMRYNGSNNNGVSEGKSKTKRRAPLPTDLNLNGATSVEGVKTQRGDRDVSTSSERDRAPGNDAGLNFIMRNHDSEHKPLTSSELELSRSGDKNGRSQGDQSDAESHSSSRPNTPPVISINYRSRISESQPKTKTSVSEDDDAKTRSRVTQTQLNSDEQDLSPQILLEFYNYSRNVPARTCEESLSGSQIKRDLIKMIIEQQRSIQKKDSHINDLESYIDNLIVKVIDLQPKILRAPNESPTNPPSPCTPRDTRGTMTLPANMKSYRTESKASESKASESLYGRIVRSASIKSSSERIRSPFKAIQAVLK